MTDLDVEKVLNQFTNRGDYIIHANGKVLYHYTTTVDIQSMWAANLACRG